MGGYIWRSLRVSITLVSHETAVLLARIILSWSRRVYGPHEATRLLWLSLLGVVCISHESSYCCNRPIHICMPRPQHICWQFLWYPMDSGAIKAHFIKVILLDWKCEFCFDWCHRSCGECPSSCIYSAAWIYQRNADRKGTSPLICQTCVW